MWHEMDRTVVSLKCWKEQWIERGQRDARPGYRAFAARQAALWEGLRVHAQGLFNEGKAKYKAPANMFLM